MVIDAFSHVGDLILLAALWCFCTLVMRAAASFNKSLKKAAVVNPSSSSSEVGFSFYWQLTAQAYLKWELEVLHLSLQLQLRFDFEAPWFFEFHQNELKKILQLNKFEEDTIVISSGTSGSVLNMLSVEIDFEALDSILEVLSGALTIQVAEWRSDHSGGRVAR
ncbi:hypothetical protein CDAR_111941 [Caerostris darwini]|uniref:ATP synthase F0 subunit 8 n=1 Tax=Caerostris darwini TaxID=1538125 RepID=A0AAV4PRH4_9ARAC|nr:hypothetical protein CDAR_111941 [Caerostris darwini]